jgi:lipid II:glycine glycyltransferase (peptidoglycan interpeptide bridge formation enzyme)
MSHDRSLRVVVSNVPSDRAIMEWDELARTDREGDITQLSCWARVRATAGYDSRYLFAYRDDHLVGGAQILLRRIPLLGSAGYVAHGPVLARGEPGREHLARDVAAACASVARTAARVLVIQPLPGESDIGAHLLHQGFRPSSAEIAPAMTLRLGLAAEVEELRAGLTRRLRQWTGRWEARGVTVRSGTEDDVVLLARLMAQSAGYQQYQPFSADYVRTMYRELTPGGHAELLVGEADGRPVAASLFTMCGGAVRFRLTGFDRESDASRLKVPAAIMWEAIKRARSRGHHTFDFGGLSARSSSVLREGAPFDPATLEGPDFFKAGFGGTPFAYPEPVESIPSRTARVAYDYARGSRRGRLLLGVANRHMRGRSAASGGTR